MNWILDLYALILGIVQGITEFLPISSTGHMIIVNEFIKLDPGFKDMFLVVVQLGSIFAVLFYFHKKLFPLQALRDAEVRKSTFLLWCKAAVGVIPAIIIGGLFGSRIQHLLYNTLTVAIALIVGGVALLWIETIKRTIIVSSTDELSFKRAFLIGIVQCLAMIPGTSRSASTILGSLMLGTSRQVAVAYSLLKHGAALTQQQWIATAVGFVAAFFVAWAVIAFFMNYIRRKDFKLFGWYRIVLGIILILLWLLPRLWEILRSTGLFSK